MKPLIAILIAVPSAPIQDWTPHTAAALLDRSFPSPEPCQRALTDARLRESHAAPVHGLSYTHLFEQAQCDRIVRHGTATWHIRMHWKRRQRTR